ncbi:MAG: HD domain-containing phosphohydrolase [Armatimonadota bacterium]
MATLTHHVPALVSHPLWQLMRNICDTEGRPLALLDVDGRVISGNTCVAQHLGVPLKSLLDTVWWTLIDDQETQAAIQAWFHTLKISPSPDLAAPCRPWQTTGQKGVIHWMPTVLTTQTGHVQSVVCVGGDWSSHLPAPQLTSAFDEELRLLQQFIDAFPTPVFYTDCAGKYLGCNQEFTTLLGRTPESIIGHTLTDLAPAMFAETCGVGDETRWLADDPPVSECSLKGSDGTLHQMLCHTAPFQGPQGEIAGHVGVLVDISDRKLVEDELTRTIERLGKAFRGTIDALAATTEWRDPYTAGHQRRVALLAEGIARQLHLPEQQCTAIRVASLLHDTGKIAVPIEILAKPRALTPMEFGLITAHAQVGYEILQGIEFPWPIADIVRQHHWRLDGSGYPSEGFCLETFCLEAQILGVADVVEAMSSHRPYRPALGVEAALAEIQQFAGVRYANEIVAACATYIRDTPELFSESQSRSPIQS